MPDHDGYIHTTEEDAHKIAIALKQGATQFSWTSSTTTFRIYMIPSSHITTCFLTRQGPHRWVEHGMVIVSVEGNGCFNFNFLGGGMEQWSAAYVQEKLSVSGLEAKELAELFNMISRSVATIAGKGSETH